MAPALSVDLRERVAAAIEAGDSCRALARDLRAGGADAGRAEGRRSTLARRRGAGRAVPAWAARPPGRTGPRVGVSSLSRSFKRAESTGRAAEQEDVKAARLSRFERQLDLDPDSLVSPDETATNTKMARRYGRAPRGERCRVAVPFGHWKAITVTAGPRTRGLTAKHGSMDR
jgi:hypothetical protein